MFANPEVSVKDLPSPEDVDWQKLHPRYALAQQLVWSGVLVAVALAGLAVYLIRGDLPLPLLPSVIGWVSLAVILLGWPVIAIPRCGFALREHDMVYRQGVVFRKVTAVPFNRIQHVEVSSGPIDRRFHIATLKLYTAGGSGGDLSIDGLPAAEAEQLRDYILAEAGVAVERD